MQNLRSKSRRADIGLVGDLPSRRRDHVGLQIAVLGLFLGVAPLWTPTAGDAEELATSGKLPFTDPYAFVDRFTDSPEVKALGFPVGPKPFLTLGMIVQRGEAEKAGTPIDIVSAKASNGQVTVDLRYNEIGIFDLWDKFGDDMPVFDPESHKGTWIITATDSKGASATTQPVLLEYGFEMPFVENLAVDETASGDLTVTWSVPELDPDIAEKCDVDYRLRLLQSVDKQLYRSDAVTETSVTVPADTLKEKVGDNREGVWGRIETFCRDKDEKDAAGVGEAEARSNTFFPLQ